MMHYLSNVPVLGRSLVPRASDKAGVGRIMGLVRSAVQSRTQANQKATKDDMLHALLKRGISEAQIDAELVIALVAGSDTTSTSIQSTLLAILLNHEVYRTLKTEIQTATARGKVSFPAKDAELKQLCYLQACVLEGLRKFPPLSQLRERMVPAGGDIINGHHIPGGTYIGLNAWGTQLSSVYGDDPDIFRPERWLTDDPARLEAMYQTHGLIFGHGSTKCLGVSMAVMELNKVIFEILRNFDLTITNPYRPWVSKCYGIFFQRDFDVNMVMKGQDDPPTYCSLEKHRYMGE